MIRRVINRMVMDVAAEARRRLLALAPASVDDIRGAGAPVIAFSAPMAEANQVMRDFLFERMYRHWRVNRTMAKSRRVVQVLFSLLHGGPQMLPPVWRARAGEAGSAACALVVCDYIAGHDRPLCAGGAPAPDRSRRAGIAPRHGVPSGPDAGCRYGARGLDGCWRTAAVRQSPPAVSQSASRVAARGPDTRLDTPDSPVRSRPMTENIFTLLTLQVRGALADLVPDLPAESIARVLVEPPRDASHGDMATNAALVAAKPARMAPQKLAAALAERLRELPIITGAEPAGPGFVNLRLREDAFRAQVPAVLRAGTAFGDSTLGAGVRANVEYVSANPTGPMHVGHCRGAVVGDALANLMAKAGWAVTKEYYVNDAGAQVQALGWAAYWRYLRALAPGSDEWNAEQAERRFGVKLQYRGDYLVAVGDALAERFGETMAPRRVDAATLSPEQTISAHGPALDQGWLVKASWIDTARETAVAMMMAEIREDLALLGVEQDVFTSERALVEAGAVAGAVRLLEEKGLIYEGVLEPPKGKTPDDWEPRPQTLFRATDFGDDVDRPLRKSDGSNTYFANDIAYHADKIARGQDLLIDVWGADHGGYVSRMQAAVRAASDNRVPLEIVLCQIVHVMKAGEPVRMSKRAGTYITLRDLIEEVGRDAVRFTMLTRKSDAQMEFDLDKVVEQTRDNPVFYVQYAHARCRSVLRQAGDPSGADLAAASLDALSDPAEMALIRRIAAWPRTVEAAATAREPHRIAFYLHDLAADFHVLWNRGREDSTLRFIRDEEPEATRARLALVAATATVIRSGLGVMGVTPVEEMR